MKNSIYILLIIIYFSIYFSLLYYNNFESKDIKIFDENKNTYNIGDLMLIPCLHDKNFEPFQNKCKNCSENNEIYLIQNNEYFIKYPNSIFTNYLNLIKQEKTKIKLPNINLIQKATDLYEKNISSDNLNFLNDNIDSLFVHIRSGDKGNIENEFINIIKSFEIQYNKIIILCGIHNEIFYNDIDNSIYKLTNDINIIIGENKDKYIIKINEPDIHLFFFRKCKNLLLHKTGFSALGSILFTGNNLYITKFMNIENYSEEWHNYQNSKINKYIYL